MSGKLAHKIGSLLFCPDCGTLLNFPEDGKPDIPCEQCGHLEPASSYENIEIVTRSHPDAFPSALHQRRKTQTKVHAGEDALLRVTEKCPSCGHMEAYSKELQLRSADEGSTILYTCVKCKHGWRTNN
ncbi:DNA-directed RNA polymerase I core subunit rpa12 [Steccherinum ochraceum]|uniref:DNA-directed RNA polymerase subunit n=1 Tax=Steccherinum ochraceum TaxID=92696 RepID=A0A4R0RR79_9APHY|nr:DNA-directed RNA polymerase I core subunit rpa12 [Steccherinum ochraceum]